MPNSLDQILKLQWSSMILIIWVIKHPHSYFTFFFSPNITLAPITIYSTHPQQYNIFQSNPLKLQFLLHITPQKRKQTSLRVNKM